MTRTLQLPQLLRFQEPSTLPLLCNCNAAPKLTIHRRKFNLYRIDGYGATKTSTRGASRDLPADPPDPMRERGNLNFSRSGDNVLGDLDHRLSPLATLLSSVEKKQETSHLTEETRHNDVNCSRYCCSSSNEQTSCHWWRFYYFAREPSAYSHVAPNRSSPPVFDQGNRFDECPFTNSSKDFPTRMLCRRYVGPCTRTFRVGDSLAALEGKDRDFAFNQYQRIIMRNNVKHQYRSLCHLLANR